MLDEYGLSHRRIKPHCTDKKGPVARVQRTLGELLAGEDLEVYHRRVQVIDRAIRCYNENQLHSPLGFLRPVDYNRGAPAVLHEAPRRRMAQARHRRKGNPSCARSVETKHHGIIIVGATHVVAP